MGVNLGEMNDKNHTGLSPRGIPVIRDFVFNSDRVSPGRSTVIGLENGTYFPVDLVLYLRNSSTWYSSYTIPVGISLPTVAMYRLHRSYHIYVQATLVPSKRPYVTYHDSLRLPTMPTYKNGPQALPHNFA